MPVVDSRLFAPQARTYESVTRSETTTRGYTVRVKQLLVSKLAEDLSNCSFLTLCMKRESNFLKEVDSCCWAPCYGPNQLSSFLPTAFAAETPHGIGRFLAAVTSPAWLNASAGSPCTYVRVLFDVAFCFLISFPKESDTPLARPRPVRD